MIINVLSTFDSSYDQWILDGSRVITLTDIKDELSNI